MKLTNQQISAIVNKVREGIRVKQKAERESFYKDKELIKKAKDYKKLYDTLPVDFKNQVCYSRTRTEKDFLDRFVESKPSKIKDIDSHTLTQNIILMSINCNDLEDIKKKLNITF